MDWGQQQGGWSPDEAAQEPREPRVEFGGSLLGELPAVERRRRRPLVMGLAMVVVVGALVAIAVVSRSGSSASASALVLAAPGRNAAAGPVHVTADIVLSQGGFDITALKMTGAEDPGTRASTMSMGDGRTSSEIRLIDGIEYFSSALAKLPDGKSWVRIDPKAMGITPMATSSSASDPLAQLQLLGGLVGDPTRTGTDTVDGADVTRYDVTLDFTTMFDKVAKASSALGANDTFVKGMQSLGTLTDLHHVPGHVALDGEGRAREFSFKLHLEGPKKTVDEVTTMHFADFGSPVTVEIPPADETVDFSEVPDVFKNITGG